MGRLRGRQRKLGTDEAADWARLSSDEDGEPRPRVLLEVSEPAEAWSYWRLLGRHGYDLSWCPGPTASSSCVLVDEGHCPLIEEADFVVTALKPDDAHDRPVLEHLHDQDCMKPIIAVGDRKRWSGFVDRFKVLDSFRVGRDLLSALDAADRPRRLLRSLMEVRR